MLNARHKQLESVFEFKKPYFVRIFSAWVTSSLILFIWRLWFFIHLTPFFTEEYGICLSRGRRSKAARTFAISGRHLFDCANQRICGGIDQRLRYYSSQYVPRGARFFHWRWDLQYFSSYTIKKNWSFEYNATGIIIDVTAYLKRSRF